MDVKEEYQDPDYHETSAGHRKAAEEVSDDDKLDKIRNIIRREFNNELEVREKEVIVIDQRLVSARRLLHKLRYALVSNYYRQERLQLSQGQLQDDLESLSVVQARPEMATLLREGQKRIHPSIRKLLGKDTVDLSEIFKSRGPRNKTRKDYYAMVKSRNVTTPADTTKSLRPDAIVEIPDLQVQTDPEPDRPPDRPRKVPRHLEPKIQNVFTIDEATRNKMKQRYRIIIGNTSKYAPPASLLDRSTHKWLLYVRGPPAGPDGSRVLAGVTVRLHHSYAPHHTVHLLKPPFHVSRRGWGEFPAKVELHFALASRNRPATVEHTIKLDRNYTGLQTLGAETVVDVWLYSTPDMLEFEYKEPLADDEITEQDPQNRHTELKQSATNIQTDTQTDTIEMPMPLAIKEELEEYNEMEMMDDSDNSWMDFFSKSSTEVNVDEMLVKTNKEIDNDNPTRNVNKDSTPKKEQKSPKKDHLSPKKDHLSPKKDHLSPKKDHLSPKKEPLSPKERTDVESELERDGNIDEVDDYNLLQVICDQPELEKKRIVKYIEPTTGKIYYLEMDRKLDLSKVQELVIESETGVNTAKISPMKSNGLRNVRKQKKNESLLKPEFRLNEKKEAMKNNFKHIDNDHCYFSREITEHDSEESDESLNEESKSDEELEILQTISEGVKRLQSVRMVVDFMLKKIPLISDNAQKQSYVKCFPFVVESEERYWKLDFSKRRNIEWSRAKLINKTLQEKFGPDGNIWRTKQILIYSRLHGYYPVRTETVPQPETTASDWSSWQDPESSRTETHIKEIYPRASDICTLSVFDSKEYIPFSEDCIDLVDFDDEIDVVDTKSDVKKVLPVTKDLSDLTVLPVSDVDRQPFLFVEKICADIGIELRNEDVGNGYTYSAVHAVMLSALRSFAEELTRSALAARLAPRGRAPHTWLGSSRQQAVRLEHVFAGATRNARLLALAHAQLGARAQDTSEPL